MKIRMTADSTCDLTPELIRKYEIGIAPLSVVIDGEVFHDGVDVTPRDIFRAADAGKSVRTDLPASAARKISRGVTSTPS